MIFKWIRGSSEKHVRVLFPFKDDNDNLRIERLWCKKKGKEYTVDNIPFYTLNIACGDIIEVEKIDNELWFDALVKASGNSVIQLRILDGRSKAEVGQIFKNLGCDWEGSDQVDLISIDIPPNLDYEIVKKVLDEGEQLDKWDYREACLGWK